MKNNLIFIGMPAVGKSTVGVVIAKRLGLGFLDTDLLIQEKEGRLLRDIIKTEGQDGFLKIENRVNKEVDVKDHVISPGGSVVYCEEAMEHFKEIGTIVYLKVSCDTIIERIKDPKKRGVVLKQGQTLEDLYEERTKLFEKYADIIVNEDGLSIDNTIEKVVESLNDYNGYTETE